MPTPVLLMARELHHMGGSERQMTETALGLDRTLFEPHVGTFRPQGLRRDQLIAEGVPVVQFPLLSFKSWGALSAAAQLVQYVRRHDIRIVHTFDAPTTAFAMPVTRYLTQAKAVSSQRGHRALTPEYRRLLRWTDRLVDGVVVNCEYLKKHLIDDEGVPERLIRVCYNGIDLEQFNSHSVSLRPLSLPEGSFVVGVVCALRPEKSLSTLVDAFAQVRPLRERMKLAIIGSGPELPALQRRARQAGVFEDCVWEPATGDVARWLRHLDVFVLPSASEAFSNSIMEAMACGCAVIASDVGGNPELVADGDRGLLFKSGDANSLTAALTRMMTDESLRRRTAAVAANFIRDGFSRAASARRMGEIYQMFGDG